MFKFRGQRTLTREWISGWYVMDVYGEKHYIVNNGIPNEVHPTSLSISIGKLDSTRTEIFASFEVDGKMTVGGDVVDCQYLGTNFEIVYSTVNSRFEVGLYLGTPMQRCDSCNLTIIGKQGGGE